MRQTAGLSGQAGRQATTSWIRVWKAINHPVSAADKPEAAALGNWLIVNELRRRPTDRTPRSTQ